ncbi:hypothetical protein FHX08_005669 [Rhizobium sp. BK529]|uniref:hypothetical protein n=1 Tax=unclassified Rhizobium TaxID=2613769 RepID=UPI00104ACD54|nr:MULTISPECIES: hypothetical protein [unclassified Rhizobium]MBB3595259.1 hypothetical protein [Rhizobium sp. BK529]TCR94095.1 hypothetical protein EV281_1183 [Rhizobium sp. BK418]
MKEVVSDSFHFGLRRLLEQYPELQRQASVAHYFTELIETYGDALRSREKYGTVGGEDRMLHEHYVSVCNELEMCLLDNLHQAK